MTIPRHALQRATDMNRASHGIPLNTAATHGPVCIVSVTNTVRIMQAIQAMQFSAKSARAAIALAASRNRLCRRIGISSALYCSYEVLDLSTARYEVRINEWRTAKCLSQILLELGVESP
jgi:hypothetical protein